MPTGRSVVRRAQDQPVERDPAQRSQHRCHVAMRQRPRDPHLIRPGADHCAALEQRLQPVDNVARQLAQVGESTLLRTTLVVTVAFP